MDERPIGMELRRLSLLMSRYMEAHSNCKRIEEITGTNGWVIAYIGAKKGDTFQRDLERTFGITRSTASKTVDAMVKKGFIERKSVDYDARLKKLVLTEKAVGVLDLMDADGERMEAALMNDFSEEERKKLRGYIARKTKNLENYPEDKVCSN